jgi:uncharacterized membrane protein
MRGHQGLFIFRRVFIFVACLLIVLFVSSPAVIFSNLKAFDNMKLFDFEWTKSLPVGGFVHSHMAPLMVIGINQVLI